MGLRICVLASGSKGNCVYIASDETSILVDAGLSGKETAARLEAIGVEGSALAAICLTHEHEDHRQSLGVLHRRYGVALYANSGTVDAVQRRGRDRDLPWQVFATGERFSIGDLEVVSFPVPHDSYDPVGFLVSQGDSCVGVVTDIGSPTNVVRERLRGCRTVVLECNHDVEMLRDSPRPWSLKQRIAGRQGHLSNVQTCELLKEIAGPQLNSVFLAHLSEDCNNPALARNTVRKALEAAGHGHVDVKLTYSNRISDVVVC